MNKYITALMLTVLICAVALCGCGNGTPQSSAAPVSSEAPAVSSEAPASSSEAPAVSPEAPASSSKAPAVSSEAPAASSEVPTNSSEAPAVSSEAPTSSSEVPAASSEAPAVEDNAPVAEQGTPAAPETEIGEQQQSNTAAAPKSNVPQPKYGPVDKNGFVYDPSDGMYHKLDENGQKTGEYYNPDVYDPDNPTWGNPGSLMEKYIQEGQNPGHIILDPNEVPPGGTLDLNEFFGSPRR